MVSSVLDIDADPRQLIPLRSFHPNELPWSLSGIDYINNSLSRIGALASDGHGYQLCVRGLLIHGLCIAGWIFPWHSRKVRLFANLSILRLL